MLDESEVIFRVRLKGDNHHGTRQAAQRHRVMCDPDPRTRPMMRGSWRFLALLMVLAFLGHDVLMAAQRPALAAERPSLALTLSPLEASVVAPHPHGCAIGQTMVLKAADAPLRQSTSCVFVGHPLLTQLAGLPSHAAIAQARSPTAQRVVLQVFRL